MRLDQRRAQSLRCSADEIECGTENNLSIEPGICFTNVIEIVGKLLSHSVQVGVGRQPHLSQSSHPWPESEAIVKLGEDALDALCDLRALRARADKRHVSLKNIQELRKLVHMCIAEEAAQPSDAYIARH